jgi:hypothetical protein
MRHILERHAASSRTTLSDSRFRKMDPARWRSRLDNPWQSSIPVAKFAWGRFAGIGNHHDTDGSSRTTLGDSAVCCLFLLVSTRGNAALIAK